PRCRAVTAAAWAARWITKPFAGQWGRFRPLLPPAVPGGTRNIEGGWRKASLLFVSGAGDCHGTHPEL
ncbi:MAG: hypothetical protein WCL11_28620, partial [Verrucomicrobiota bacterium]